MLALFSQLMMIVVHESDFFLSRFISPVMCFSYSCYDCTVKNELPSFHTFLLLTQQSGVWCALCLPLPLLFFIFFIFSVVGATSLSAGPKQPSPVCRLVETCNLPPSLSQTHNTQTLFMCLRPTSLSVKAFNQSDCGGDVLWTPPSCNYVAVAVFTQ